jgi:uncharacterized membrane protein
MAEQLTLHTLHTLIDDLVAQNLLSPKAQTQIAEALTKSTEESPTPWFISALIGISAWLSIIPFIVFLYAIDMINTGESAIVVGFILIIGTVVLHYFKGEILFIEQLALALNFTGQVLFIIGIANEENVATAALATFFLEIVLIGIYRNSIIRFLGVTLATAAVLVLLYDFDIPQAIHILIVLIAAGATWYWIEEAHFLTDGIMVTLYQPLRYGFVIALQMVLLLSILPTSNFIPPVTWWYSTLGLTVLLLALEYHLLQLNNIPIYSPKNYVIFTGTLLLALLLYQAPGIIASIILLLLGFQRGNRVLMGLAIIFISVFFVAYYYYLNITLLMKSITLMSAGVALLALRFASKRVFPLPEGGEL